MRPHRESDPPARRHAGPHSRGLGKLSPCKYDAPEDPYVAVLLDQNIAGEQCAISTYKSLMDATKDKDMVTYNLALGISSRRSSTRRISRACARTWT